MLNNIFSKRIKNLETIGRVPIYIISFNRLRVLSETIESYQKLEDDISIVILDTGSTYEPLLDYYKSLERQGVKIYYLNKINKSEELNNLSSVIESHNKKVDPQYYALTDPDVSLEGSAGDTLRVFASFLEHFSEAKVVGPMLRIEDIPREYPARQFVYKKHIAQFWHKKPLLAKLEKQRIYYQFAKIDTTFGLYKADTIFQRKRDGIRIYYPYEAKHLDWYITPQNITEDQIFYNENSSSVAHWSGEYFSNPPRGFRAEKPYYVVHQGASGKPRVEKKIFVPDENG
ncbi:hypothetical protein ACFL2D_01585 [Patescibacteria group bacterium]